MGAGRVDHEHGRAVRVGQPNVDGDLVLRLGARGEQRERRLLRSSGVSSLDQAALSAVAGWQFRAEVREWISGNYCRCTGYHAIVDAICDVLQQRKEAA